MNLSDRITLDRICFGADCPLSAYRHRHGVVDPFNVIHFGDRRFSRRAAKNLLTLVARRARLEDPDYLNDPALAWYHLYDDAVGAQHLARFLGFRLPSRLFDPERRSVEALLAARPVALSHYERVRSWLRG